MKRATRSASPRKRTSTWSSVNIKLAQQLIEQGLMQPAGLEAFKARRENRSGIYAYEQRSESLPERYASKFKKHKLAWQFFQSQPAWYRKTAMWHIVSAKKEETRLKRLEKLIEDSAAGRSVQQLARKPR
jgi:uncharacterized protein YdeI (YjbR/CyaY-like superfamily)